MADTPKQKDSSSGSSIVRWLALGNEAIGKGITNAIAGVGFITVDAINNAPRLVGLGKISQKPVGGSDWIYEKMAQGKAATDNLLGAVAPTPETTAEKAFSKTIEVVTEVALPFAPKGLSALKGGASAATKTATTATRIEPVMEQTVTAAAAKSTAKAAEETAAATVKKAASMNADDVSGRLAAAKRAGEAERAGQTAAGTAKPGLSGAETSANAGKSAGPATDGIKATAEAGKTMGWWKARSILHSPTMSLGEKVRQFAKYGREDFAEKVLVQARQHGLKEADMDKIRKIESAPDLIKKYDDLFTMQQAKGLDAKIDTVKATLFGNASTTAGTIGNATLAGARLYKDALLAPVTLAKGVYGGLTGPNSVRNIALGGTALLGTSWIDAASDGTSSLGIRSLGTGLASSYGWFLEKNLNGAVWAGEKAYGLYDSEAARTWAEKARQSGQKAIENIPGTITRATGVTPEQMTAAADTLERTPIVGMAVRPVRDVLHLRDGLEMVNAANQKPETPPSDVESTSNSNSNTPDQPTTARQRAATVAAAARDKVEGMGDKVENAAEEATGDLGAVKGLASGLGIDIVDMGKKIKGVEFVKDNALAVGLGGWIGLNANGGIAKKGLVTILATAILAPIMDMLKPFLQPMLDWMKGAFSGFYSKYTQNTPDHAPTQTAPRQTVPHAPGIDMRAAAPAPTQKPAITTETNLGQQFNAAQNATTPLDASRATSDPAANQSPVAGAFAASALPQNLPPAPVLAQVGDPSKNAKNDHLFNVPSVA